jgi:hypothetical protein
MGMTKQHADVGHQVRPTRRGLASAAATSAPSGGQARRTGTSGYPR